MPEDISRAIVDRKKRMAGDKFFALLDEEAESDRRLDEMADGLTKHRAQLEERAKFAINTKHDRIQASIDYVDRLEGKVKALEDSNKRANGGPTVGGSEESPKPSPQPTNGAQV